MTTFGLVQAAACRDISCNLQTVQRFAREAANRGCTAVCFPECFLTGYDPEEAELLAVTVESAGIQALSAMARDFGMDLMVGFMERQEDRFFITQGLFRPDGSLDYYRKTHLGKKEAAIFTPGDSLDVFSLSCGWKVGFQLCVETHFPEITQTLALKGAEAIFAPHASPTVSGDRETIWDKYIPARSYDNRVYLLCCNLWEEERFSGGCLGTDPKGERVASHFEEGEALVTVQLDKDQVVHYRSGSKPSTHFFPTRRRPELYQLS